jgi:hypothetical protein
MKTTWHFNIEDMRQNMATISPEEHQRLMSLFQLCTKPASRGANLLGRFSPRTVAIKSGPSRCTVSISFAAWPPVLMFDMTGKISDSMRIRCKPIGVKSIVLLALSQRSIQPASLKIRMSLLMSAFVGVMRSSLNRRCQTGKQI